MNNLLKIKNLPALMLASGLAGLLLQKLAYVAALDEKGLLIPFHPVELSLWLLSLGAFALVLSVVMPLKGTGAYQVNFPASHLGAAGQYVMAAALLLTVLIREPAMGGTLSVLWWWFGILAALSMIWTGTCRLKGRVPGIAYHLPLCVFLALHIVLHYQSWSSTPQLQDYLFHMLAGLTLLFFAYYHTAFAAGLGKRRLLLTVGLLAIYFGTVALADSPYRELHAAGVFWAFTNLCAYDVPGEKVAQ